MDPGTRARVWRWVAIATLVGLCGLGMNSGMDDWTHARNTGQRLQVASQLVYATAGLLAATALAARWPFARRLFRIFAIGLLLAAGLAPVYWGEQPWWTGALAALAGVAIVWLVWLAFKRGDSAPVPSA
jgi:hypothetical protein